MAQKKNEEYKYYIKKASSPIMIDGVMNEEGWKNATPVSDFFMVLPMDTGMSRLHTEFRMTYDQRKIYIIATCFKNGGPIYVESLRRDWVFPKNDNFSIYIDPFNNQTNGFSFGCNAAGAQRDGILFEGGTNDLSWDNKWMSAVKQDSTKWVVEIGIPFKSIRYREGITEWGINFSRSDLMTTEKSSWAPVPRQFPTASLAYAGTLVWDEPPPKQTANISFIPYVLASTSKNYEQGNPIDYRNKIGSDIKVGITSSLNLDLTINPDFSQVEVDQQVTNLDRFELFFPERRQFFLENADLFANFGYANIRPFFSRRIGLNAPIIGGARLSGNLNKDWRIGLMDMQTGKGKDNGMPGQNFAVVSLQRRVFNRSSIGVLFVNKQSSIDTAKASINRYNRNFGLEYNLASRDNLWTGKAFFLKSFTKGRDGKDMVQAAHLRYNAKNWNVLLQQEFVGKNYIAEAGFIQRSGYIKLTSQIGYLFFPQKGKILSYGPQLSLARFYDERFNRTDDVSSFAFVFNTRKASTFRVSLFDEYLKLLKPFDPTNSKKDTLPTGSIHQWKTLQMDLTSKPQSLFTYTFNSSYGGYYANGTRLYLGATLGYRFQPYVSISANVSYNNIHLPQPWNKTVFWLTGSQVDVTLTNKIFFYTFFQYNSQQKNININTRFQWRYNPVSDLFIVYTDNYFPAPFSVRSRALVLKLTYWWNK